MAQIGDPQSAEGPLEPTGSAKKKIMSSNLLNMKFMQRGRDADVAAKLQEQYKKEVSDQQWHLSIVHETKASKFQTSRTNVSYEPSYRSFETKGTQDLLEKPAVTEGRKIFGSFVPDIDELVKAARGEQDEEEADEDLDLDNDSNDKKKKKQTDSHKPSKRIRVESDHTGSKSKSKRPKKKKEV